MLDQKEWNVRWRCEVLVPVERNGGRGRKGGVRGGREEKSEGVKVMCSKSKMK